MSAEYRGVDHRGVSRCGTLGQPDRDVATFVEARYRAGWRSLTVIQDGVQIAAIVPASRERRGGKTWWAEATPLLPATTAAVNVVCHARESE